MDYVLRATAHFFPPKASMSGGMAKFIVFVREIDIICRNDKASEWRDPFLRSSERIDSSFVFTKNPLQKDPPTRPSKVGCPVSGKGGPVFGPCVLSRSAGHVKDSGQWAAEISGPRVESQVDILDGIPAEGGVFGDIVDVVCRGHSFPPIRGRSSLRRHSHIPIPTLPHSPLHLPSHLPELTLSPYFNPYYLY